MQLRASRAQALRGSRDAGLADRWPTAGEDPSRCRGEGMRTDRPRRRQARHHEWAKHLRPQGQAWSGEAPAADPSNGDTDAVFQRSGNEAFNLVIGVRFPAASPMHAFVAQLAEHRALNSGVVSSTLTGRTNMAPVTRLAEYRAFNPGGVGSSPTGRTRMASVAQLVEQRLGMAQVAGSSPVGGTRRALVAQLGERRSRKAEAVGSIPAGGTTQRGRSSGVEHRSDMPVAVGSNPTDHTRHASVAQLAVQLSCKEQVTGSKPVRGTSRAGGYDDRYV